MLVRSGGTIEGMDQRLDPMGSPPRVRTRIAMLPREVAYAVTVQALTRTTWWLAAGYLLLAAVSLVDLSSVDDLNISPLLPTAAIAAALAALALMAFRPGPATAALYLLVGTASTFAYQSYLLGAEPQVFSEATFVMNRLPMALVLMGVIGTGVLGGVLWSVAGYVLGGGASMLAYLLNGVPVYLGWGPTMALIVELGVFCSLALIRRSSLKRIPDFAALEAETMAMVRRRQLEEHASAIIHDTVLSDLATIASSGDALSEQARGRFLADLAVLTRAEPAERMGTEHGDFYRDVLEVVSDFRWRGLSVDVSGGEGEIRLGEGAHRAMIWALRACLDNVASHAETDSAEVFLSTHDDAVTMMVVDQGRGFDPASVPGDRLGIRLSITGRIEDCGGSVRLWSSPETGTSVIFTVPQQLPEGVADA